MSIAGRQGPPAALVFERRSEAIPALLEGEEAAKVAGVCTTSGRVRVRCGVTPIESDRFPRNLLRSDEFAV